MSGPPPQRVDRVTGPLVPGQFYLVPTVRYVYFETVKDWPVIGPQHSDVEFFDFARQHFHIDRRFLRLSTPWWTRAFETAPLCTHDEVPLPAPIWRRRKCLRAEMPFDYAHQPPVQALQHAYASTVCARGKAGWICPHRHVALGSLEPRDGVITCPLHGLRIDAASGAVLPGNPLPFGPPLAEGRAP